MTIIIPEINKLSTDATEINCTESVKYLAQVTNLAQNQLEAEHVCAHIEAIIKRETSTAGQGEGEEAPLINQAVLNLAFRCYYQLVHKYALEDIKFARLSGGEQLQLSTSANACDFQMLHAVLLTEHCKHLQNSEKLKIECLRAMTEAVEQNNASLLAILKAFNLLCKKFNKLYVEISLDHFYHCLQSNQVGMREETLILFSYCCKKPQRAFEYFKVVLEFWPWTNRNKFYLLSCILNTHHLHYLLSSLEISEFYSGLRLSLNYKNLFAASQYLVKSLSAQESQELLELSADILTHGTLREIQNYYSQWFLRINQKDALFILLQQKPEVAYFLGDTISGNDSTENYRLILIFSMFSRQIFQVSKLHFFKISTELITKCFAFELDAQLLIYRFIVENFANFAIEDCLEFILNFIKQNKSVESSQSRNNILCKMPTIINYISKTFSKLHSRVDNTTLESSIQLFFYELQQIIDTDVYSKVYQPKIFALKLLEILLKSLYAQKVEKNAKNCSLIQNQHLGSFLIEQQVFNAAHMSTKLLSLLDDPLGFDDAFELIVTLLQQLNYSNTAECLQLNNKFCQNCNVDICVLSTHYAKVAVHSFETAAVHGNSSNLELFNFAYEILMQTLSSFQKDPLHTCRKKHHLFGFINTINEIVLSSSSIFVPHFKDLLKLLDTILNIILNMLNLANKNEESATVASFQDIDESLELLVQQSACYSDNHEKCRKFLLMSFWLTLKASCGLATTIGCILAAATNEMLQSDIEDLEQCLKINISVLTRCRHKGAIEAAGVSIGKLSKCITTHQQTNSKAYELLYDCLQMLCDDVQQVSTTRRGAGFSIMFLHIIKNEEQRARPLLERAVGNILKCLQMSQQTAATSTSNCDRMDMRSLHYLCVLVKDTELRSSMSKYHNEIMLATISKIDNPDWTVCNAALQLFGALIPKIVGQKQATEYDAPIAWEPTEFTYSEIERKLPKICEYILDYCSTKRNDSTSTRSIILFLSFLAQVEHLRKSNAIEEDSPTKFVKRFRVLMWKLLLHNCEKVRKLAAICFVRAHEFRCDLPQALLKLSQILFDVENENFFEGLIFALSEGVLKIQHESKHTMTAAGVHDFMQNLQKHLTNNFKLKNFKWYTVRKLLDLFLLLGLDAQSPVVSKLVKAEAMQSSNTISYVV